MKAANSGPIRVLIAEDSPTVRSLLVEIFGSDPSFKVIGEARSGTEAVEKALRLRPDVITMDVHMPGLDGINATKEIMREAPTPIIIVSAITARGDVDLSFSALQAGALMAVEKPESPLSPRFEEQRQHLLSMSRAMAGVKVVRRWALGGAANSRKSGGPAPSNSARIVAIGTSTGGPAALSRILMDLPNDFGAPILVVQHIAPGFVEGLARWLGGTCKLRVQVAVAGAPLSPSTVYLAPDDRHLGVTEDERVLLSESSPIGGFRPSADFLFESVARTYGASATAAILTGMGRDGVDGLQLVRESGGRVLAQDEATSVVYGMAQAAVERNIPHEVVPLDRIAQRLRELVART